MVRRRRSSLLWVRLASVALASAASAAVATAEVKVTVDRNAGDKATADFKFDHVPSPAKAGTAAKATVTVVDGEKDEAAGHEASALTTAAVPGAEDEPDNNFFFAAGTDGGRLQIDLGKSTPVTAVNTYSWHANTRGPQVYKLYAADGTAAGFKADPKKGTDPTTCGWKLVATVDTRPKVGDAGGQYGVNIADPATNTLGAARYLLIDAMKTESDDEFGNTFFSRIDVMTTPIPGGPATMPAK